MNGGSWSLSPFSQDQALVMIALVLVTVLAVLTIIGMAWGARLKAQRRAAEQEEQRRIEELKADGVESTNTAEGGSPAVAAALSSEGEKETPAPAPAPAPAAPARDDTPAAAPLADEPIAAAAPLDASPATIAADTPPAPADDAGAQSITILKGLGPKIAMRLEELGITRVDQLAWIDDAEAADLDRQLGAFQGRMERDRWRDQARLLARGDRAAYEAQFGKLG